MHHLDGYSTCLQETLEPILLTLWVGIAQCKEYTTLALRKISLPHERNKKIRNGKLEFPTFLSTLQQKEQKCTMKKSSLASTTCIMSSRYSYTHAFDTSFTYFPVHKALHTHAYACRNGNLTPSAAFEVLRPREETKQRHIVWPASDRVPYRSPYFPFTYLYAYAWP